jgi:hypothetical protein
MLPFSYIENRRAHEEPYSENFVMTIVLKFTAASLLHGCRVSERRRESASGLRLKMVF